MWKPDHRPAADRRGLRHPSDLTDAEWAVIAPPIPPARRGGRERSADVREVLDAIFDVLATGCRWKALPKDLPPKSAAHFRFMPPDGEGTLERIHEALCVAVREAAGREASPSAAIIDSQSAEAAQEGALRSTERYDTTVAAFIHLAMIRIMLERSTEQTSCSRIHSSRIGSWSPF